MALYPGTIALLVVAGFGVVFIVLGGVLIPVFKSMIHKKIHDKLALKNGSDSFDSWVDPPATVYMKFYMFDVVNAADILANGSKPVLKEKGPYVYREIRKKENVTFSRDGTQVSYVEPKGYVFEPHLSKGTENDTFTTINLLALAVGDWYPGGRWAQIIEDVLELFQEKLFDTFTVGGFLWGDIDKHLHRIPIIRNYKFGIFTGDKGNLSSDGKYVVDTGTDDINKVNTIYSWNGGRNLTWWNTKECNMINGTDGTMWHPFVSGDETLYLFSSDICRSIYLTRNNTYRFKERVKLHRFIPPPTVFADPNTHPDNKGFCPKKCLKAGVLDISRCSKGQPVIMSLPHFYQADPEYLHDVEGLKPDAQLHSTVIDVEPITGVAFVAHKRLQINFQIHHANSTPGGNMMKDGIIFPILWLDEGATIDNTDLRNFEKEVQNPVTFTIAMQYSLVGFGGLLLVVVLVAAFIRWAMKKRTQRGPGLLSEVAGDE